MDCQTGLPRQSNISIGLPILFQGFGSAEPLKFIVEKIRVLLLARGRWWTTTQVLAIGMAIRVLPGAGLGLVMGCGGGEGMGTGGWGGPGQ